MLSKDAYDALVLYRNGPVPVGSDGLSAREADLFSKKLIEPHEMTSHRYEGVLSISAASYHITPAGEDALLEFEKEREKEAEQKRQYNEQIALANEDRKKKFKHDWRIAIFSAISGFILGLIVEYLTEILAFLFGPH